MREAWAEYVAALPVGGSAWLWPIWRRSCLLRQTGLCVVDVTVGVVFCDSLEQVARNSPRAELTQVRENRCIGFTDQPCSRLSP